MPPKRAALPRMNVIANVFGVNLDFTGIVDHDELVQAIEDTSETLLALERAVDRYDMEDRW